MLSRKMGKQHISRLVLYHQQRKPPKVMVPLAWRQMYLAGGGLNKYVFIQQHRTTKIKISKLFNYCRCNVNISMFDRSHHQCHPAPRPRRHREVSWSHDWCCLGNWKNGRARCLVHGQHKSYIHVDRNHFRPSHHRTKESTKKKKEFWKEMEVKCKEVNLLYWV